MGCMGWVVHIKGINCITRVGLPQQADYVFTATAFYSNSSVKCNIIIMAVSIKLYMSL